MVFYFTGTGNSLYIAKQLAEHPISIPQAMKQDTLDFTDKTVIPFCTSTSDGIRQSENTLKTLAKGSNINWVDGQRFSSGTSADAVTSWIESASL